VPLVRMPVAPGRNIAILVEVAARNQLLKERGVRRGRAFRGAVDALSARGRGRAARPATAAGRRRSPPAPRAAAPAEDPRVRAPRGQAAAPGHHRPLRIGQDPRLARPRGRRLVLRRQPAHRPHSPRSCDLVKRSPSRSLRPSWWTCAKGSSCAASRGLRPAPQGRRGPASCSWKPTSGPWSGASARPAGPIPSRRTSPRSRASARRAKRSRPIRKMRRSHPRHLRLHGPPAPRLRPRALRARAASRHGRGRDVLRLQVRVPAEADLVFDSASCPTRTSCPD
jgi:hypothetical protein